MRPEEMLKGLAVPFPPEAIKRRQGGGGLSFDYVETHTVIHRLNTIAGEWSFSIKSFEFRENMCIVVGELHIPGLGTRSGIGVQALQARGGEDLVKGASSDALKKAATLFGVALPRTRGRTGSDGVVSTDKTVERPVTRGSVGRSYDGKKQSATAIAEQEQTRLSGADRPVTEGYEEVDGAFDDPEPSVDKARMKAWQRFATTCRKNGLGSTQAEYVLVFNSVFPASAKDGYKGSVEDYDEARETIEESPLETIKEAIARRVNEREEQEAADVTEVSDAPTDEEARRAAVRVLKQTMVKYGYADDKAVRRQLYRKILGKDTPDSPEEVLRVAARLRELKETK